MPTVGEGGVVMYEVSCDWRFQPPNTLLKQEGLQLAVASFREELEPRKQASKPASIAATVPVASILWYTMRPILQASRIMKHIA